jgi:hypothetical protein
LASGSQTRHSPSLLQETRLKSTFPMFVPNLSWQIDDF